MKFVRSVFVLAWLPLLLATVGCSAEPELSVASTPSVEDPATTAGRLVYHGNFAPYRDPAKYIRIAQAAEAWQIVDDREGRHLRLETNPGKGHPRALLVWDLAPIRFQEISFLAKRLESEVGEPLQLSLALQDVAGRSFVVDLQMDEPALDGWIRYHAILRDQTRRIYDQGKEISPFVHGRGEVTTSFEGFDFDNTGFSTVFIHIDELAGAPVVAGFKDLRLTAD